MYEQLETGPLYDKVVQRMSTYRSVAARMQNARASTQGKLDRRLEGLGEKIAEQLSELSPNELQALTCWKNGVLQGYYEVDHEELMSKPYISIRKIDRWTEEYDADEIKASLHDADEPKRMGKDIGSAQLRAFLSIKEDY